MTLEFSFLSIFFLNFEKRNLFKCSIHFPSIFQIDFLRLIALKIKKILIIIDLQHFTFHKIYAHRMSDRDQ